MATARSDGARPAVPRADCFELLLLFALACTAGCAAAKPEARVTGGADASGDDFGFAVQVGLTLSPASGLEPYCSGSLIAPDWVITAGACVGLPPNTDNPLPFEFPPEIMWVVAGTNESVVTGSSSPPPNGQLRSVTQIITHPLFDFSEVGYAVALLKLNLPVLGVPTVALAAEPGWERTGADLYLAGYGSEVFSDELPFGATNGKDLPQGLHYGVLDLLSEGSNPCVGWSDNIFSGSDMLCMGGCLGNVGACVGDLGAPVTVLGTDGEPVLVGVFSIGPPGGCLTAEPEIASRVDNKVSWIVETAGLDSGVALGTPCTGALDAGQQCQSSALVPWAAGTPAPSAAACGATEPLQNFTDQNGDDTSPSVAIPLWSGGAEEDVDIFGSCPDVLASPTAARPSEGGSANIPIGTVGILLSPTTTGCLVDLVHTTKLFAPCVEINAWFKPLSAFDPERFIVTYALATNGVIADLDAAMFSSGRLEVTDGANPPQQGAWTRIKFVTDQAGAEGNTVTMIASQAGQSTVFDAITGSNTFGFATDDIEVSLASCSGAPAPSSAGEVGEGGPEDIELDIDETANGDAETAGSDGV